jgi:hypothetical protein
LLLKRPAGCEFCELAVQRIYIRFCAFFKKGHFDEPPQKSSRDDHKTADSARAVDEAVILTVNGRVINCLNGSSQAFVKLLRKYIWSISTVFRYFASDFSFKNREVRILLYSAVQVHFTIYQNWTLL